MRDRPEIRYAKSGGAHIAYQTGGEGPPMVSVWGANTNMATTFDVPAAARYIRRLQSFTSLVAFDERGTGLSDPPESGTAPTLEQRADDLAAVMDEVGFVSAYLYGQGDGGAVCIVFATRYPSRTDGLILHGSYARMVRSDEYPIGHTADEIEQWAEGVMRSYGDPDAARRRVLWLNPGLADDPESLDEMARYGWEAASPAQSTARLKMFMRTDVRALLHSVKVPTLILHQRGDRATPVEHARYLARNIDGARLVEFDGADSLPIADPEPWLAEIQEFVTGSRAAPPPADRVLASVLFTDVVGSTERAVQMGDARWRELLDRHDDMVRRQLVRFSGVEVKATGDGFLATFDSAARAVGCARAVRDGVRQLGLEVRAGVHAGEVERRGDDISGIAVHVAERISTLADPSEILVSGTVRDLVAGSGIEFEDRGAHTLRGVPDEWRVLAVSEAT